MEIKAKNNHSISLLSFDIDNTIIELETLKSRFTQVWEKYGRNNGLLLTYNSGRLYKDVLDLVSRKTIPEPSYIIGGVGTHIYDYTQGSVIKEFSAVLDEGWDLEAVKEVISGLALPIEPQPKKFQHAYKRSYFLRGAKSNEISQVEKAFSSAGLDVNVVYSGDQYLDILPKWANKGNALQWLLKSLDIPNERVIVAGDSGNDTAMFNLEHVKGIAVENAREELYQQTKYREVYHAERAREYGVIEGLVFYGVFPDEAISEVENGSDQHGELLVANETEYPDLDQHDEKLALIREGYHEAVRVIRKNITPIGFIACPIEDNDAVGTDENYHSVWARDGAITIIGTIPLVHDEEIRQCQKQTFVTLLEHISMNGQIPSNVRLRDASPDYSGVGGICSIDSGLWVIIAFYEFINATEDIEFLRQHINSLQRAMDWLSAQDGNNDALLEIPEAGDWTDLFGRSYHVLYDEVLWYWANVCFGRLQEMLGNDKQAGDYIRWSQVIKKEILDNFWPNTQVKLNTGFSFAEKQFSLGDTKYLVAQITPFDFSWRCDSFGNILAYLFGVLGSDKAFEAFRFMVGVGMNEPYPVRNVYPVVNPGDPDWRSYYTVNLLNLPHHYHNGGIWPFVGAFWVQFIEKLGLRDLALSELYKLALLNQLGSNKEWEFTEWAHGLTGKPMGKVYQAWSAAQYILACHRLKIVNNG